jgi:RimJ/RimL family protein N-acetyltransferase
LMITIGQWALRGYGYWSVDRTADAAFIGRVGVIFPIDSPEPELAWSLFDGFEGHGYGSESVVGARQYADTHFGLGPLASFIDPSNTRSLALATRVGACFESTVEEDGETLHLYRHPHPGAPA